MKRMVFGLGLLLSGIIGFVGWCIAAVQKGEPCCCRADYFGY